MWHRGPPSPGPCVGGGLLQFSPPAAKTKGLVKNKNRLATYEGDVATAGECSKACLGTADCSGFALRTLVSCVLYRDVTEKSLKRTNSQWSLYVKSLL